MQTKIYIINTQIFMETTPNTLMTVAYELYVDNKGERELVEKAPKERPFQFITGLGTTLDAFEKQLINLKKGDKFDFTLPVKDAYEEREEARVIEVSKDIFKVDGKFDEENIFAGNVIPLSNADGDRFNGLVAEVKEATVVLDMNHPLAGKDLSFVGEITEARPATQEEIQGVLNLLSGEGCGCGCDSCDGECNHDHQHGDECGCGHCH